MSNFSDKNNNRKNHAGGNRQHINARNMRKLINGAFGNPSITVLKSYGWNDLIIGTSGKPRAGGNAETEE